MQPWKLKRTRQCGHCPWRVDVNPYDIPNGYDPDKHRALAATIAEPGALPDPVLPLQVMACHETADAHCVGWLHHQIGTGNNLALRMRMLTCANLDRLEVHGQQHASFEATLPAAKPVERDGHQATLAADGSP